MAGTGGDGIVLRESAAAVFSCSVAGSRGDDGGEDWDDCTGQQGGPGGDGMHVENAVVLLQASTLEGGAGGHGDPCECCSPTLCGDGGYGGAGLHSLGQSEINLVMSTLSGGAGGFPGEFVCSAGADGQTAEMLGGTLVNLPLVPRALETSSPLREGEMATAVATGEPLELLAVYASSAPALVKLPSMYGFQLLGPPLLLLGATVLPADGVFQIQAPVPDLGVSVEGVSLRLQTVGLSTTGGFALGEAATMVLLDAAL